jgi:hypothetical protein
MLKNESVFGTLDLRLFLCKLQAIPDSTFKQALSNTDPYKYMWNLMYDERIQSNEDWNKFIYFIKCKFDNLI